MPSEVLGGRRLLRSRKHFLEKQSRGNNASATLRAALGAALGATGHSAETRA